MKGNRKENTKELQSCKQNKQTYISLDICFHFLSLDNVGFENYVANELISWVASFLHTRGSCFNCQIYLKLILYLIKHFHLLVF
jgi:hypothetical protein